MGDDTDMDIPPPPRPPQLRKNLSLTHFHDLQDHPFSFNTPTMDQCYPQHSSSGGAQRESQQMLLQRQSNNHHQPPLHQHPHQLQYPHLQHHHHPTDQQLQRELNYRASPLQYQLGDESSAFPHQHCLPLTISNLSSSPTVSSSSAATTTASLHQHHPPQMAHPTNLLRNYPQTNGQVHQQQHPSRLLLTATGDPSASDNDIINNQHQEDAASCFNGPTRGGVVGDAVHQQQRQNLKAMAELLEYNKQLLLRQQKTEDQCLSIGFNTRHNHEEQHPPPPPDICNVSGGGVGVGGERDHSSEGRPTGINYEQMMGTRMNAMQMMNNARNSGCGSGDQHRQHVGECLRAQQEQNNHKQRAAIDSNGDTLTRPNCFMNASLYDNFGKCFQVDVKCGSGGGQERALGDAAGKCVSRGDYNELMNKCVGLHGGGNVQMSSSHHLLDCRTGTGSGAGGGLCFENCNYGYGPDTGDLLLLENDLVHGTGTSTLMMKARAMNGGSGPVTPTASMNSNGMMPWRHRQCSSSRGSSSSASSSTRKCMSLSLLNGLTTDWYGVL